MAPFCLTNLAATGVARRDEGLKYGITDPVLWVYDQAGDFNTLVKTREARDTLMPVWSETICLDFAPGPGVGDSRALRSATTLTPTSSSSRQCCITAARARPA